MSQLQPIPILHLITELSAGGAQSALARLLAGIDRHRYSPTVACYYNADGIAAQRIRELGVTVIDLGMTRKWRVDAFARLGQLLRQQRPAILHTWMFHANVPGRVIGRAAGVPVIISSERSMGAESAARYRLNAATANLADAIICVSQRVADFARDHIGLPPEKLLVVPNGIDTSQVRVRHWGVEANASPVQMLYLGRLAAVKGVFDLIQAANMLQELPLQQRWRLTMMGDGPLRDEVELEVHVAGLDEWVTLRPAQQDVLQRLADYDMLVLASHWEGMPNAAIEAMAAALPVVATAVGGTPEVVLHGETGLLVPPHDEHTLANALALLVENSALRESMGLAGRKRVEQHFTIEQNIATTEALYERLLARKGVHTQSGNK